MKISNHPGYRLESVPEPPTSLSKRGKQEWKEIAPVVFELRTARPADLRTLALLCEILADIDTLQETIRKDGILIGTGTDSYKTHPAQKSLEVARRQAQNLLDKFDLVPGSKARQAPKFHEPNHKYKFG